MWHFSERLVVLLLISPEYQYVVHGVVCVGSGMVAIPLEHESSHRCDERHELTGSCCQRNLPVARVCGDLAKDSSSHKFCQVLLYSRHNYLFAIDLIVQLRIVKAIVKTVILPGNH